MFRKLTLRLFITSASGLAFCRLEDLVFFPHGHHQTPVGHWILCILAITLAVTVFILFPLQLLLDRSEVKKVRERWTEGQINPEKFRPHLKHIFYANYRGLPRWIYLPFVIIAIVLAAVFALCLGVSAFVGVLHLLIHSAR